MKNVISQPLGLDLVNINVYAKVYQNIPLSSRDRAIFTFSEFEPRQRLGQSQMTCDILMGYILSISMPMQNLSTYSKRFKSYGHFSRTGRGQNLHKLSGEKIKCLIIERSMKFNFQFQLTFLGSCNKFVTQLFKERKRPLYLTDFINMVTLLLLVEILALSLAPIKISPNFPKLLRQRGLTAR